MLNVNQSKSVNNQGRTEPNDKYLAFKRFLKMWLLFVQVFKTNGNVFVNYE